MLSSAQKTINEHWPRRRSPPMTRPFRIAAIFLLLVPASLAFAADPPKLDPANTAWMLTSSVLVLFMTLPGLALFYGGLVRTKNVLSILMQCFSITCVVTIAWVVAGYSIAFGDAGALNAWYGGFSKAFLSGIDAKTVKGSIPETVFAMFQLTFAIITPALVIGAYAERVRYSGMLLFSLLWLLLVYCPVAHWVWGDGWLAKKGIMDFAGGTVVHLNAGIAALVCALVLGRRRGFPETAMPPHNMAMTVTGACMLWVGWFGFNAGSALAADGNAGMAMLRDPHRRGHWVSRLDDLRKAALSKAISARHRDRHGRRARHDHTGFRLRRADRRARNRRGGGLRVLRLHQLLKQKLKVDDSLDVFPVHGVGGALGRFSPGSSCRRTFGGMGLPEKMSMGDQLLVQVTGVIAVGVWSGVVTLLLLKLTNALTG
jgi:Amt family ammonium transporter